MTSSAFSFSNSQRSLPCRRYFRYNPAAALPLSWLLVHISHHGRQERKQMPAVRDVGARFIAPDCRHAVRQPMYGHCSREPWRPGFSSYHHGRGQKCALVGCPRQGAGRPGDVAHAFIVQMSGLRARHLRIYSEVVSTPLARFSHEERVGTGHRARPVVWRCTIFSTNSD